MINGQKQRSILKQIEYKYTKYKKCIGYHRQFFKIILNEDPGIKQKVSDKKFLYEESYQKLIVYRDLIHNEKTLNSSYFLDVFDGRFGFQKEFKSRNDFEQQKNKIDEHIKDQQKILYPRLKH